MHVAGVGTAVPPHRLSQQEALELTTALMGEDPRHARLLRMMFRKARIGSRHTVLPHSVAYDWVPERGGDPRGPTTAERMAWYGRFAPELAERASREALDRAGVGASGVTHLVLVTCTGFEAPGIDLHLIESLGLPPTTQRALVGFMGCHAAINGLRVARGLAAADPGATILLCAVECCSLHYRTTWDEEGVVGNALFGDGAAALVLRAGEKGKEGAWRVLETGSVLLPDSRDAMSWRIGDHGFEMRLTSQVSQSIRTHLRPWLDHWLDRRGESVETIGSWAVHPGGPKILEAAESALGLDRERTAVSREVLARYGNMSSPTVLFLLDRIMQRDAGSPCLLLAFGPGLVAEAALLGRDPGGVTPA